MRIIAFVNNNSGPGYHRIIMPLLLMQGVDVFVTNNLLEEHFEKGCDVFMYNRVLPDHAMVQIKLLKKKYGFKTVVDVDDFWELDEHHILYHVYKTDEFARKQIEHIRNADVVFTTHWRLVCEIQAYNLNVHVLPNAIPKQGQFDIEKKPHHLTRLFWQGSITHVEDIAILKRPIDCLATIAAKIQMVIGGYMDGEDEWYKMVMDYTAKTKHQYKLLPGAHVAEYYKHYEHADICLIPLVNSPFNRMKSNLKVLEAANLALPVICSPVHPYMDLPVIYAKGAGDWIKNIQRLVASKKRQKEAGGELAEYCLEHFNFYKINKERKQILEHVAKYVTVKSI
jgi:sulfur relay (sulfurtransferase) DsrC/TusE family protein